MAVAAGREVAGRYILRRPLASGGMAQVWEADDTVLGRAVAMKVLHPHLAADPQFLARFRDEAKAAARLSHQSIVAIYDTASEEGLEAIVMELIDGITLRQYLDDFGALSLEDAADLTTQVADALDAAHAARIVHRDIKPGNIILCPDRRVKVTDFGIAKALEGDDRTAAGTLLGTAKYLAPEQVEGTPVDQRADIYSLGVVLYEALTGRAPFDGETPSATALARLRDDPPPPRQIAATVPPAVERVVMTALARDRDRRFPTAGALRDALAAALDEPSAPVDPTVAGPIPIADPGTAITGPPAAPVPAPPRHDEPVPYRRPIAGRVLVTALILGCLGLGVGLILATGVGRDFFSRLGDTITGGDESAPASLPTDGDAPSSDLDPGDQADPGGEGDDGAEAEPGDGEDLPAGNAPALEVVDFDPLGDGTERPDLLALATDGDPDTAWTSEGYSNRTLGNLKEGVGLVVMTREESTLTELRVVSATQGWAASVYAADAPAADLDGWGDALDARVDIAGSTTFDLRGVRASAVLLWITDLGDAPPSLRIEIAELDLS